MKKLYEIFWVLTHPSYWIMVYSYSEGLDELINYMIDNNCKVEVISDCEVFLIQNYKKLIVWTENFPYAYGCVGSQRPSRLTINRLSKYIMFYGISEVCNEN